ncbi:exopolysaccharide biosynthesis protein [Rickettsiales bacterium]|nr:exopolysaccharide biosynthesis protein [Rickettsiales bacterium]
MDNGNNKPASDVLEGVVHNSVSDYLTLFEIKDALHERGFGLLMLVFALPLSIPMPIPPGFTLLPAIPLLFFSWQMMAGKDSPWLPAWAGNKKIKRSSLAFMIEKASPFLRKVEKLLRPRLSFAASDAGEKIVGVFCFVFAVSIANPVPLSNMIPAMGITLMSLGLLSKDGVPIIMGMVVGSVGVAVSVTLMVYGIIYGQKAVNGLMPGISG